MARAELAAPRGERASRLPHGTVGKHANGKFACEVCGAEFKDDDQVTSHYVETHAS